LASRRLRVLVDLALRELGERFVGLFPRRASSQEASPRGSSRVALQNDVHCTTDSMFDEQFWSSEPLFVFEMIGNHGLARLEGVAGRRTQISADGGSANYTFAPADPQRERVGVFLPECTP
jgi:hypothetical protein